MLFIKMLVTYCHVQIQPGSSSWTWGTKFIHSYPQHLFTDRLVYPRKCNDSLKHQIKPGLFPIGP